MEEKLKKRGSKKSKRQVNIQEVQVLLKGVTEEKELSRQDMAEDRRMSTPGIKNKGKGRKGKENPSGKNQTKKKEL